MTEPTIAKIPFYQKLTDRMLPYFEFGFGANAALLTACWIILAAKPWLDRTFFQGAATIQTYLIGMLFLAMFLFALASVPYKKVANSRARRWVAVATVYFYGFLAIIGLSLSLQ